jgi:ADP-heptose:LPS heptosyltransferase
MLNPDSGQSEKEWPDENWIELIQMILKQFPHRVLINLARPHSAIEAFASSASDRITPLHQVELKQLIHQISLCEGIITVDAGPQHLAHALNVPSLTLYGPRDERRWGDLFNRPIHQIVRGGMWDLTPEETRGLPPNHLMRLILPATVFEQVKVWLRLVAGERITTR